MFRGEIISLLALVVLSFGDNNVNVVLSFGDNNVNVGDEIEDVLLGNSTGNMTMAPPNTTALPLPTCQACSQQVYVVSSATYLPSGPFEPNCMCRLIIGVPSGDRVNFQVSGFHAGSGDLIQIYDITSNTLDGTCNAFGGCFPTLTTGGSYAKVIITSISGSMYMSSIVVSPETPPTDNPVTPTGGLCSCPGNPVNFLPKAGQSVTITSPNYPGNYPNDCNCIYQFGLSPNSGTFFHVAFSHLDLEYDYDYVAFYTGNNTVNQVALCDGQGDSCPPFNVLNYNWMTMVFESDVSNTYSGYSVTISAAKHTACDSNPCRNGGNCTTTNGGSSYQCHCPSGFTGTDCTLPTCFVTVENNGIYILGMRYSTVNGGEYKTLQRGSRAYFTSVASTNIKLNAVAGRSTTLPLTRERCSAPRPVSIVCGGTSLVGFYCRFQ